MSSEHYFNKKPGVGVGTMILKDNRVLLGKRHDDPGGASSELHGEGSWTMPGGKLHFKEGLKEAAFREVLEETGVEVDKERLEIISVTNDIVKDAHFVTIGFLCRNFPGEPKAMEPDEITEWQWFELDKLPQPMFPPSQKIVNNFLKKHV